MHLNPDLALQLARDRQELLRADAAASRLVCRTPARERVTRSLRRIADRLDARAAARPGRPCAERN
jgi:hypothetical protein